MTMRQLPAIERTMGTGAQPVRGMVTVLAALALVVPARDATAQDPAQALAAVSWITGCWRTANGVEEHWTDGTGGQMFGVNRTLRNGRAVRWEFLRIYEGRSALVYAAAPSHQPPAEFAAAAPTAGGVVFENPQHDFPTTITYRSVPGDSLVVTVAGPGEGGTVRAFDLRFGRISCDATAERNPGHEGGTR